jgi:hypothetical protein
MRLARQALLNCNKGLQSFRRNWRLAPAEDGIKRALGALWGCLQTRHRILKRKKKLDRPWAVVVRGTKRFCISATVAARFASSPLHNVEARTGAGLALRHRRGTGLGGQSQDWEERKRDLKHSERTAQEHDGGASQARKSRPCLFGARLVSQGRPARFVRAGSFFA